MRLKVDRADSGNHKCCFCFHCRTGTLLLGLWHLIGCIFVIGFLLLSTFHPNVLLEAQAGCSSQTDGVYLSPDADTDAKYSYDHIFKKQWTKEDLCVAFALTVCSLMITLLLVYGTIKNRPGYLMPFFCLQVFSFCLGCLTVVGYFSYAPNVKMWLRGQCMAYFIGVVWSCYKFLQQVVANHGNVREFTVDPDTEVNHA
ncbi:hypothetical protein ScPMuIL_006323 [Solemya velum]